MFTDENFITKFAEWVFKTYGSLLDVARCGTHCKPEVPGSNPGGSKNDFNFIIISSHVSIL